MQEFVLESTRSAPAQPTTVVAAPQEVRLSVVIPVYNGAPYLESCLRQVRDHLIASKYRWEILVAEDGSTDGTKELCRRLRSEYPDVDFTNEDQRLGRGASLTRSLTAAEGDVLVYADVDMATDPSCLDDLVTTVTDGFDIVTGSRYLPHSSVHRTVDRLFASRTYNWLVRRLLGSTLSDHQCGFKAFKRDALLDILPQVKSNHWFWDTELLVRAQHAGLAVKEIPVTWHEDGHTTVSLARDTLRFLADIGRLRKELRDV